MAGGFGNVPRWTSCLALASGSELVGASCTPTTIQFIPDTQQAIAGGIDTWCFLMPDYAFGHATQRASTTFIQAVRSPMRIYGMLVNFSDLEALA